jgi:uncharacterized membrane protein YjjP (DUF1212 family)
MATFNKITLSGSTDGRGIKVAATASAGTTIHTASSTATTYDEIWLYVQNTSASSVKLTVQLGGTTSPDDYIEVTVAAEAGLMLVVPGLVLKGNASPLVVRSFAATANVLTIHGYVNRITA